MRDGNNYTNNYLNTYNIVFFITLQELRPYRVAG